jgi:hypothetical protein
MGTGDFAKEKFSKEELDALGEAPEAVGSSEDDGAGEIHEEQVSDDSAKEVSSETGNEEKSARLTTEEKEVAQNEGVKLIEENGRQYLVDDEGAKIPVERWRKNYARTQADIRTALRSAEETNRKLNLLKELGEQRFYEIYPDEMPAGYQPSNAHGDRSDRSGRPALAGDFSNMTVEGGKYDGRLLGDVAREDPLAANLILNNYLETAGAQISREAGQRDEFDRSFAEERDRFCLNRAKELFNKTDNFTDGEKAKIAAVYEELSRWMIAGGVPHYNMEHAWFLMNKDRIIQSARATAAEAAVKKAIEPGVKSIGSKSESGRATDYDSYLTMTEDALADAIDGMSDARQKRFYKEAPQELRNKYPALPW